MDEIKAKFLFDQINGTEINSISIEALIDYGKSAAVYRGRKDNKLYAVKIFDPEITERFGFEIQRQRTELELSLKNHAINNLVKILDGGIRSINNIDHIYLIMEHIEGVNLKKYIENNTITIDFITRVINTLIETTEKLFQNEQSLVHRDIKPENIMVRKDGEIILMDLGVLKPVATPSMTDVESKQFLGTLQYAPPEFLTRTEEDSLNGWRAVNIYQIGAVLHDLIMKKELFSGVEPYPNLVIAIKEDMPQIISTEYHPDLIQLARNMLHKDWRRRLVLASIDIIKSTLEKCLLPKNETTNYYNDIKTSALPIQTEIIKIEDIIRSKAEKEKIMLEIHYNIWNAIDEIFLHGQEINEITKKVDISKPFVMDSISAVLPITKFRFYRVDSKFEYGFAKSFLILLMVGNDENSYVKMNILGIIPSMLTNKSIEEPEKLMYELFTKEKKYPPPEVRITNPSEINLSLSCFFDGIIEFEDTSLKNLLDRTIARILKKVVQIMKPEVQQELERRKNRAEEGPGVYVSISRSPETAFVYLTEHRQLNF
jgi:serine/threonine protein kinase